MGKGGQRVFDDGESDSGLNFAIWINIIWLDTMNIWKNVLWDVLFQFRFRFLRHTTRAIGRPMARGGTALPIFFAPYLRHISFKPPKMPFKRIQSTKFLYHIGFSRRGIRIRCPFFDLKNASCRFVHFYVLPLCVAPEWKIIEKKFQPQKCSPSNSAQIL